MHDAAFVTVLCSLEKLVENAADLLVFERRGLFVQELLDVLVKIFEDEKQFVPLLSMDDVLEVNDPLIIAELLQHSDLTDGCARDSIVTMINFDLFDCYNLISTELFCHMNDSISALTKFRNILESIN